MEDDLKELLFDWGRIRLLVSILVLMEDDLKEAEEEAMDLKHEGFNPCFNGRWSERGSRKHPDSGLYVFQSLF